MTTHVPFDDMEGRSGNGPNSTESQAIDHFLTPVVSVKDERFQLVIDALKRSSRPLPASWELLSSARRNPKRNRAARLAHGLRGRPTSYWSDEIPVDQVPERSAYLGRALR
jgi:hypothetical protein